MESTVSVSKGVFLFSNGFKKKKTSKRKSDVGFIDRMFEKEWWYMAYKRNWDFIDNKLKDHHYKTYNMLLNNIVDYIKEINENREFQMEGIIPSATLLTGVSQPDHASQFTALIDLIRNDVTPHVALVSSQDAHTIKHLVENVVYQFINQEALDISENDDFQDITQKKKVKRNQCTMKTLKAWYYSQYFNDSLDQDPIEAARTLVIIIPDFESFNCNVLQDFVMIVSSYMSSLPLVFVFGVATSVSALHKSFPYHVSSKLLIKVFHSHSSPFYMNQVLEEVFLTHTSPFQLSGKAFELLTDVFLFYDFSVTGLVQSIKYCMMDHYYGDNVKSLCCDLEVLQEAIMSLTSQDLENIRQLLSFRPYLEKQDCKTKISLFKDDQFFRSTVYKEMSSLHDYLYSYYVCVRLLSAFVKDLPKNLIGKTVREIYTKCAIECITDNPEFKECMQLINFQSQIKLVETLNDALKIIQAYLKDISPVKPLQSTPKKNNVNNMHFNRELGPSFVKSIRIHLLTFLRQMEKANSEATVLTHMDTEIDEVVKNIPANRYKLKEKLLKATKGEKIQSEFEMIRSRFVNYLEELFYKGLQPPHTRVFYEILFFTDVSNVKKQIVGSPRGALHTALSNPVHYLQCSCCHLPSPESIVDTLPDVCLAYKLHRECGKHINLYDWLQAFAAVIIPDVADEQRHQDAGIRKRFTHAVAELQFLGFIKSSKRKTDHVMRLTW